MSIKLNTELFNETDVIRSKQELVTDESSVNELLRDTTSAEEPKPTRGRKRKYATDEERILARRAQQKAYRERKKKELAELRALKASLEGKNNDE